MPLLMARGETLKISSTPNYFQLPETSSAVASGLHHGLVYENARTRV
jgi:hypothetical protein